MGQERVSSVLEPWSTLDLSLLEYSCRLWGGGDCVKGVAGLMD